MGSAGHVGCRPLGFDCKDGQGRNYPHYDLMQGPLAVITTRSDMETRT
jgi:hypothetical protein